MRTPSTKSRLIHEKQTTVNKYIVPLMKQQAHKLLWLNHNSRLSTIMSPILRHDIKFIDRRALPIFSFLEIDTFG